MGTDTYLKEDDLVELAKSFVQKGNSEFPHYTKEFKRMIVRQILVNHVYIKTLSRKTGIPRQTIYNWISKFAEEKKQDKVVQVSLSENILNVMPMSRKEPVQTETPEEELARLKAENRRLQEALKMSEWMNHAKDVMIDQAEKTFNIPIRKKSGAKQ